MDLKTIESIINLAQSSDPRRIEASSMLDQLRQSEERWSIGLSLFFESRDEIAQYFGLSLVRDWVASTGLLPLPARGQVRQAILGWMQASVSQSATIHQYILNNAISIITQLIKFDYPESWPSAFADLLLLGRQSLVGLDVAVRVMTEFEVEVVMFNDARTKAEIAHNTHIKDTMRAGSTAGDIVIFLCESVNRLGGAKTSIDLCDRTLRSLSNLVGWFDVSLIANLSTMTVIYQSFGERRLRGAASLCLTELVKKGMDPLAKFDVLTSVDLLQVLNGSPPPAPVSFDDDEDDNGETEYSALIDTLFTELLGVWITFEDTLYKQLGGVAVSSPTSPGDLAMLTPTATLVPLDASAAAKGTAIAEACRQCWTLVLAVFSNADTDVATGVLTSLSQLIGLLKQQLANETRLVRMKSVIPGHFTVMDLLTPLLLGIYKQMQYDDDFGFDFSDEEDCEVIEAKKEVRKLFVNCCRVVPEACLGLITFVLQSLPSPLSSAPFATLEAALKLVFSFSECGQKNNKLVQEGTFPEVIAALHQSDVYAHPHPQVVIAYYELVVRYAKQAQLSQLQVIAAHMAGVRGIRHHSSLVRCRSAYFLFKLAESLENRASVLLTSVVGSFTDILRQSESGTGSLLSDTAELHLLEALGLITASTYQCRDIELRQQCGLLQEVVGSLLTQIQAMLSHPQLDRYIDNFGERIAHKINSLCSLSKGYNCKTRPDAAEVFAAAADVVVLAVTTAHQCGAVRVKAVMFFHRQVVCVGLPCLDKLGSVYGCILSRSDSQDIEQVVQLLNQVMTEFQSGAISLIDHFFRPVLDRLGNLSYAFEEQAHRQQLAQDGVELPQVESERVALQKMSLVFLYHVASQGCYACLTSETNASMLQDVLGKLVLTGLAGGQGAISPVAGITLRKNALGILIALAQVWMTPSEHVPAQLSASFTALLFEQAVPTCLQLCSEAIAQQLAAFSRAMKGASSPAVNQISISDMASLTMLGEVGLLLYLAVHSGGDPAGSLGYLRSVLLPKLGWPEGAIEQLMQVVGPPSLSPGVVRESFKKFLKTSVQWAP